MWPQKTRATRLRKAVVQSLSYTPRLKPNFADPKKKVVSVGLPAWLQTKAGRADHTFQKGDRVRGPQFQHFTRLATTLASKPVETRAELLQAVVSRAGRAKRRWPDLKTEDFRPVEGTVPGTRSEVWEKSKRYARNRQAPFKLQEGLRGVYGRGGFYKGRTGPLRWQRLLQVGAEHEHYAEVENLRRAALRNSRRLERLYVLDHHTATLGEYAVLNFHKWSGKLAKQRPLRRYDTGAPRARLVRHTSKKWTAIKERRLAKAPKPGEVGVKKQRFVSAIGDLVARSLIQSLATPETQTRPRLLSRSLERRGMGNLPRTTAPRSKVINGVAGEQLRLRSVSLQSDDPGTTYGWGPGSTFGPLFKNWQRGPVGGLDQLRTSRKRRKLMSRTGALG